MRRRATAACAIGLALAALAGGCGRRTPAPGRAALARPMSRALADTGRALPLPVPVAGAGAPARVWLSRVRSAPPAVVTPVARGAAPALPEPEPAAIPDSGASAPAAQALLPPVLRGADPLRVPPGAGARRATVDLDVHVTEAGEVDVVRRAGGSSDRALVAAAIACARSMRFFPAERAGVPVAVWCTQRFEFGAAR